MTPLQSLRQAKHLARWVLVWFVMSLSAAVASPLLQPQSVAWVCTAAGMSKMVLQGDDAGTTPSQHGMHCVLCAPAGAPPPSEFSQRADYDTLGYVLQPTPAAHVAWRANALLSARGPPHRA